MIRAPALLLALLLALAGTPAMATQDGWPALYDVQGVAANDVLNVRERPDPGAPIIGTLAPDARGVEVIEPNARQTWGRVNVDGQSGWASLAYLARRPGQWDGAMPESLSCAGTEPFWALEMGPANIRFEPADGTARDFGQGLREPAEGRRDRFSFRAWADGESATGIVIRAQCSDGMSNYRYGYSLDLVLSSDPDGLAHYAGCCSLAR